MPATTVKNIPNDLYERLKQSAAENRRSINSEIVVCIQRAVQSPKHKNVNDLLVRARTVRAKTRGQLFTDEKFTELKTLGRR
ncbi:MAG: Arc family DNA-binding protein [Chloroflexi bacterium]|nr:Arc family DNA-binding protein [Chloroflexota bacterium]